MQSSSVYDVMKTIFSQFILGNSLRPFAWFQSLCSNPTPLCKYAKWNINYIKHELNKITISKNIQLYPQGLERSKSTSHDGQCC